MYGQNLIDREEFHIWTPNFLKHNFNFLNKYHYLRKIFYTRDELRFYFLILTITEIKYNKVIIRQSLQ